MTAALRVARHIGFTIYAGEHAQEILVHLAQNVVRRTGVVAKSNSRDQIHQLAEPVVWKLSNGVALARMPFRQGFLALFGRKVLRKSTLSMA